MWWWPNCALVCSCHWYYVIEGCEIWFSVSDWQDTDLVGCLYELYACLYQMFLLRRYILHVHTGTWKMVLMLYHSFNPLIWWFLFYLSLSNMGRPTAQIYCSLSSQFYFVFGFLVFLLLAIYSTSRFSFWLIFVQYICGVLFNIIRVNLLSSADKCREINNWYAH